MADEIDIANDLIDTEVAFALGRIRQDKGRPAKGTDQCVECGEDMPLVRKEMGFKFCVVCAGENERKKMLFADS